MQRETEREHKTLSWYESEISIWDIHYPIGYQKIVRAIPCFLILTNSFLRVTSGKLNKKSKSQTIPSKQENHLTSHNITGVEEKNQ